MITTRNFEHSRVGFTSVMVALYRMRSKVKSGKLDIVFCEINSQFFVNEFDIFEVNDSAGDSRLVRNDDKNIPAFLRFLRAVKTPGKYSTCSGSFK